MEVILAVLASIVSAAAVAQFVMAVTDDTVRARARAGGADAIAGRIVESLEHLGHRVWVIRLANSSGVAKHADRVRAAVRARGVTMSRYGCFSGCLIVAMLAACTGACVSGSLLGAIVALALSVFGVAVALGRHEAGERKAAAAQMPEVLRSFSTAIGTGRSLSQAVEYVGKRLGDPLGPQFLRASFEITGGRDPVAAVEDVCGRVGAPGMAMLGTALSISQKTGAPIDDLFARTTRMVVEAVTMRRELDVKTSQARLSAKVVAGIPMLLAAMLILVSPDYREGLATSTGRLCMCAAAILDGVGLMLIRSLMKVELQ